MIFEKKFDSVEDAVKYANDYKMEVPGRDIDFQIIPQTTNEKTGVYPDTISKTVYYVVINERVSKGPFQDLNLSEKIVQQDSNSDSSKYVKDMTNELMKAYIGQIPTVDDFIQEIYKCRNEDEVNALFLKYFIYDNESKLKLLMRATQSSDVHVFNSSSIEDEIDACIVILLNEDFRFMKGIPLLEDVSEKERVISNILEKVDAQNKELFEKYNNSIPNNPLPYFYPEKYSKTTHFLDFVEESCEDLKTLIQAYDSMFGKDKHKNSILDSVFSHLLVEQIYNPVHVYQTPNNVNAIIPSAQFYSEQLRGFLTTVISKNPRISRTGSDIFLINRRAYEMLLYCIDFSPHVHFGPGYKFSPLEYIGEYKKYPESTVPDYKFYYIGDKYDRYADFSNIPNILTDRKNIEDGGLFVTLSLKAKELLFNINSDASKLAIRYDRPELNGKKSKDMLTKIFNTYFNEVISSGIFIDLKCKGDK